MNNKASNNRIECRLDILQLYLEGRGIISTRSKKNKQKENNKNINNDNDENDDGKQLKNASKDWSVRVLSVQALIHSALAKVRRVIDGENTLIDDNAAINDSTNNNNMSTSQANTILDTLQNSCFYGCDNQTVFNILSHAEEYSNNNNDDNDDIISSSRSSLLLQKLHYFDCAHILKSILHPDITTDTSKSLVFASYKNPILYEWDNILHQYSGGNKFSSSVKNAHVNESIRLLQNSLKYDMPALRSDGISNTEKRIIQMDRQIGVLNQQCQDACRRYNDECYALGIDGADPEMEIRALPLMELVEEVEGWLGDKEVGEALVYHDQMQCFLGELVVGDQKSTSCFLKTLRKFTLSDNKGEEEVDDVEEVDLGLDLNLANLDDIVQTIPQDAAAEEEEEDAVEIDWDVEDATNSIELDLTDQNATIDWQIELDEAGEEAITTNDNNSVSNNTIIPVGESLLLSKTVRTNLSNDLIELSAFLKQRIYELDDTSSSSKNHHAFLVNGAVATGETASMPNRSTDELQTYLQAITNIYKTLHTGRISKLLLIKESPRYAAKLVQKNFTSILHQVEKIQTKINLAEDKKKQLQQKLRLNMKELDACRRRSKGLKKCLEEEVGRLLGCGGAVTILLNEHDQIVLNG